VAPCALRVVLVFAGVVASAAGFGQSAGDSAAVGRVPSVTPAVTVSGSDAKQIELEPRLNAARAEVRRGRLAAARKTFEEVLASSKSHPVARRYLADVAVSAGDLEAAHALARGSPRRRGTASAGGVPLVEWQILAPFRYAGRDGLKRPLEPEKDGFDAKANYRGDGRICRWKRAAGPRIDFRNELDIEGAAIGYAYCEILSTRAGWVRLGLASADGIKVWINDRVVHENAAQRRIREDDDEALVWLERGRNRVFVKVDSRGDEFRFFIQVYEDLGEPPLEFLELALEAFRALDRKDWQQARTGFLDAEALRPGLPEVAIGLARASFGEGNLVAARAWAQRGLAERPDSPAGLSVYGETMLRLGQPLRAFDSWRAAYRASDFRDETLYRRWIESARELRWDLQVGLAVLDRARGERARKEGDAAKRSLAEARPLLETTFVGLADLCVWEREGDDRRAAADLGLLALSRLTPQQVALHCSAEWLLELVKDLRTTQPDNQEARERVVRLVEQVDPTRSELIRELLALKPAGGRSAVSPRIEALLTQRPEKALYREYAARLHAAADHARCVEICRQGLEAGIVSRTLRHTQARSLLALQRFDEAEELFRDLLEESGWTDRANAGLRDVGAARAADEKRRR